MDDHPLRRRSPSPSAGQAPSTSSSPGVTFASANLDPDPLPVTPDNKSRGKRPAQQQQQQQQPLVDLDSDEDQQDDEMRPTTSYGALETTADGAARDGVQSERLAVPPSPFRSAILPSRQPHSAAAESGLTFAEAILEFMCFGGRLPVDVQTV